MVGSSWLQWYSRWFVAAGLYNALWGAAVSAHPLEAAKLVGLDAREYLPLVQIVGMMVGVYAIGYFLLAKEPLRYYGLIWVGLAGKMLGPLGYLYHALAGNLPWSFGWTCLFNDIIWWPVFWSFALRYRAAFARDAR